MPILEEWMGIKAMKREGFSIREISRRTGRARNTIRKVLRNRAPEEKKRRRKGSVLDAYKRYLKKRYLETGLSAVRLLEKIRGMGYGGIVDNVRRYLRQLDQEACVSRKSRSEGRFSTGKCTA